MVQYILLVGTALNLIGALKIAFEAFSIPRISEPEFLQLKLFVFGVSVVFGGMYLYLFFNMQYIYPFLAFGAALKMWAFFTCLHLLFIKRISYKLFYEFGVCNGIVGALFIALLSSHA